MLYMQTYVKRKFKLAEVFRDNECKINQFDFSPAGDYLVSSSDDHQIILYDCAKAQRAKIINSRKYGVDRICFAHTTTTVLHTSTMMDSTIRYLSLYDNKYIRYFVGHKNKVVSLCKSPIDDIFVSGALDKTMKVWDLRTGVCEAQLNIKGKPVTAIDPSGLVLLVGLESEKILLFDIRQLAKGPFATMLYKQEVSCEWTDAKFSPDGKMVLISSNGSSTKVFNAYDGCPIIGLTGSHNNKGIPIEASFSPDSRFVITGSTDGSIHMWDVLMAQKVGILDGKHTGPVQCVKFNPRYAMIASACTNMAFWLS